MARPAGARTTLIAITYDTIGELAGGIAGDTARQYAQRGQYDSRDLESVLRWVNARRGAKGLSPIGQPTDNASEAVSDEDSEAVTRETPFNSPTRTSRGQFYDPLTASYRFDT